MVDREVPRHAPGRAGVRAGDCGEGGGDAGLSGASGLVDAGVEDVYLDVGRHVPLPGVEIVVPAAFEEVAAVQVEARGEGESDAVHDAALHLRLESTRVDREADVDGHDDLRHARAADTVADVALDRLRSAVDLDEDGV